MIIIATYLNEVNDRLLALITDMPNKLNKPNKVYNYSTFNDFTFVQNEIVYFIEFLDTRDKGLNNEKVMTPFFVHTAIMADNGDTSMKIAPQMLKDYLNGYQNELQDSILIGKVGNSYFDKNKTIWRSYVIGEMYWNRNL